MLGTQPAQGGQLNNFNSTPAPSEEMLMNYERAAVAKKYGVLNPDQLLFKMGRWYMGELTVEEWAGVNTKDEEYWKN
jgi:hypothetical protein